MGELVESYNCNNVALKHLNSEALALIMAKSGEVVLSATERMLVEKQKMEIKRMRMTKEQLELFRDTFVIFDKDGDGTIDSKELSTVLKSMGYNPTKEEIQEMVDEVDSDGSGSIEFLEFLLLMG